MKVWLVVNYPSDAIPSMNRFAESLQESLRDRGCEVHTLVPPLWMGRFAGPGLVKKWLGYVDKLLLFPVWIKFFKLPQASRDTVVHIIDHGNAPWRLWWRSACVVVTLHDLITIRAARGEDTGVYPSRLGRWLQRGIERGLRATRWVVCDSTATQNDFHALFGERPDNETPVVLLGQNQVFSAAAGQAIEVRKKLGLAPDDIYLLHVGNNAPRKNRRVLLKVLREYQMTSQAVLVLAGEGWTGDLRAEAEALGIFQFVREWSQPDHSELCALYASAHALVFPSLTEGFGYPVIEAQACGCPVVCSRGGSLEEVGGGGVIFCDPQNEEEMVAALKELSNETRRKEQIQKGFQNAERFTPARMAEQYAAFYRHALRAEGRL